MHLIDSSNDGSMNDDNWRRDGSALALAAAAKDGRGKEKAVPTAEATRSEIIIFIIPRVCVGVWALTDDASSCFKAAISSSDVSL